MPHLQRARPQIVAVGVAVQVLLMTVLFADNIGPPASLAMLVPDGSLHDNRRGRRLQGQHQDACLHLLGQQADALHGGCSGALASARAPLLLCG